MENLDFILLGLPAETYSAQNNFMDFLGKQKLRKLLANVKMESVGGQSLFISAQLDVRSLLPGLVNDVRNP